MNDQFCFLSTSEMSLNTDVILLENDHNRVFFKKAGKIH